MYYFQQNEYTQLLSKCLYTFYSIFLCIRFIRALDQVCVSIQKLGLQI